MSRAVSLQALVALWAQQTNEAIIPLLTITHPEMEDTLRFALNPVDFVSRGETFLAFPFDLQAPSDSADRPPQGNLAVSNIDRRMAAFLEGVITPPQVDLEIVLASTPDTVEVAWLGLELQNPKYNLGRIEGLLQFQKTENEGFPKGILSPSYFPGMF